METIELRTIKPYVILAEQNTEKQGLRTIKPHVIPSGAKHGNDRIKNNKNSLSF